MIGLIPSLVSEQSLCQSFSLVHLSCQALETCSGIPDMCVGMYVWVVYSSAAPEKVFGWHK